MAFQNHESRGKCQPCITPDKDCTRCADCGDGFMVQGCSMYNEKILGGYVDFIGHLSHCIDVYAKWDAIARRRLKKSDGVSMR